MAVTERVSAPDITHGGGPPTHRLNAIDPSHDIERLCDIRPDEPT